MSARGVACVRGRLGSGRGTGGGGVATGGVACERGRLGSGRGLGGNSLVPRLCGAGWTWKQS